MILNFKYGLFAPSDWDDVCEREIQLQTTLWNKLVEIETHYRTTVELTIRSHAGYRKLALEIAEVSTEIDALIAERATQRKAARAKIKTPELDEQIGALVERRRKLWADIKAPRKEAYAENKPALTKLSDMRYAAITAARQNSGLWWGNYNAVLASFDGTLRRLQPGQMPRLIEGERDSGRLTIQIQQGCPAPAFFSGARSEAKIELDEAQWVRRGSNNWRPRRAVLTATVRAEGHKYRKTATWPMILHRPPPPGAIVKSLTITRRHAVPQANRWKWEVVLTVDVPEPLPAAPNFTCGVDLGWRKVEDGLRVATIADDNGGVDHLVLPLSMFDRRVRIAGLMGDVVKRAREAGTDPMEDSDWRRLTLEAARWNRRRRDIYRVKAAELVRRYSLIGIDSLGIAMMAQDHSQPPETRRMRTWAAPADFASSLRDAARRIGVTIREVKGPSTVICHLCGHKNTPTEADRFMLIWRCSSCKRLWDQDENAARNCLAAVLDKAADKAVAVAAEPERRRPPRLVRKKAAVPAPP